MKFITRIFLTFFIIFVFLSSADANAVSLKEQYNRDVVAGGEFFNGWISANYYSTPRAITTMKADFTVPNRPNRVMGQVNYFFPGLTTANWKGILQPVLTFSNNPNRGYPLSGSWSMEGWYVTHDSNGNEIAKHAKKVTVNPGDRITTVTRRTATRNRYGEYMWNIYMKNLTNGKISNLNTYVKESSFTNAWVSVMESYGVLKCGDLSGPSFTVSNFKTTDSRGRNMYTNSLQQFNPRGRICNNSIIQNTAKRTSTLSVNNLK